MKTLILGSGAREHALAWAFSRSKSNAGLFCMPGNAATAKLGVNIHGDPENPSAVLKAAEHCGAKLVVIGPEGPLASGVADLLREHGFAVFGPGRAAAQLESSKTFARDFSNRAGVPSARSWQFADLASFSHFLADKGTTRVVLKKSGLAAGKGVLESTEAEEMLAFAKEVLATDQLLVEEYLEGYELSVFALCDGQEYRLLPICADHKKAFNGNQGPNTGGMGAVCPVPCSDSSILPLIEEQIVRPSFDQLKKDGLLFRGVLFFGVMVTEDGPKLLEYNVRLGDPETQSLLPLLLTDISDICMAVAHGSLRDLELEFLDQSTVGITVAAPGYPGSYPKHIPVHQVPEIGDTALLFHAGTFCDTDGQLRTGGGRCFTAVGLGADYFQAYARAMRLAEKVEFEGAWYRSDIGKGFCPV